MIIYTLKRRLFSIDENGNVITPQQRKQQLANRFGVKNGSVSKTIGTKAPNGKLTFNNTIKQDIQNRKNQTFQQNTKQIMQKNQQRQITQSSLGKSMTNKAFKAGQTQGQQSVGLLGGLKNTWNKSGTLGKIGMVGAGVLTAGLAAKGISSILSGRNRRSY